MKKMMERFKNERGLTLVELLAVVVILAIIGTIAFVLIGNIIENSKKDAHIANAQQLIHAAKLYEADGGDPNVSPKILEEAEFLEPLISPWGDEPENYGENEGDGVTKEDKEYKVKLKGKNCNIEASEEKLLSGTRDELCK